MKVIIASFLFFIFFLSCVFGQEQEKLSVRDEQIRLRAEEIELQKKLKKIEERKNQLRTPSEKQAAKELEKAERRARDAQKAEARYARYTAMAGCPDGSVWVNANNAWPSSMSVYNATRVVNRSEGILDVESPDGVILRGLCPGGSVTVFFRLNIWTDSQSVQIPLTAISRANGRAYTDQFSVYLSHSMIDYGRADKKVWEVRPR